MVILSFLPHLLGKLFNCSCFFGRRARIRTWIVGSKVPSPAVGRPVCEKVPHKDIDKVYVNMAICRQATFRACLTWQESAPRFGCLLSTPQDPGYNQMIGDCSAPTQKKELGGLAFEGTPSGGQSLCSPFPSYIPWIPSSNSQNRRPSGEDPQSGGDSPFEPEIPQQFPPRDPTGTSGDSGLSEKHADGEGAL